ncbi:MAG: YfhO family protein [Anaerolineales bacterium]|nr:YfhO family protein [Anaerolineales bacterium]
MFKNSTPRLWELGLCAALIMLFFWKLAFTNLILARGDIFLYFYPYWDARAEALLAGRLPLWTPDVFMGAPFLANPQTGVLYPFNWPLAFFSAPVAAKISIVFHAMLAALGAQVFVRRRLGLSAPAGLLAAVLFACGGYFVAQAEHINQFQALAWFPFLLVVASGNDYWLRVIARLAAIIALQILAGHTQSVFISLTGLAIYSLISNQKSAIKNSLITNSLILSFSILFALLLAAAQLLPTLELQRESLRSGGLPWREAVSFSLDPRLLARVLLPGHSRGLFTEFVAYVSVLGLGLAAIGVGRSRERAALLVLVLVGLGFAFGAFNPLYAALANFPPLNLFRVPARWLFLFAFGVACLAAYGLEALQNSKRWKLLAPLSLFPLVFLSATLIPPGETGPLGLPALVDWTLWLAPLAALGFVLGWPVVRRWQTELVVALVFAELFLAAQMLPINRLTAPEAYGSIRPTMTQLLATNNQSPPARFLSASALRFDPGDLAELKSYLEPQLPPDAVYDFIIATKHKEVLSPNLPLAWGVPAVDGFDGGVLPLRHYAAFTQLFTGEFSADGRLCENITATPSNRLLSLVNARWLLTDKVNDAWVAGIFYDLQFMVNLKAGEEFTLASLPDFEATGLGVVLEKNTAPAGEVRVQTTAGATLNLPLINGRLNFGQPLSLQTLTLIGPASIHGLSLFDTRTDAFHMLTLGPYRLAHSGDVKVYENLTVLPRAFVVPAAVVAETDAAARQLLSDPNFEVTQTLILAENPKGQIPNPNPPITNNQFSNSQILAYAPELIRISATGPGYLLLTDAFYPGWAATVDGAPAEILRANLMFRAVALPAGEHVVEFRYAPPSVTLGLWVSGLAWGILFVVSASALRRQH